MNVVLITGSAGLVGAEATRFFSKKGFRVVGIDNDMRQRFFGAEASTAWVRQRLIDQVPGYQHHDLDIRDADNVERVFGEFNSDIKLVIHTAAQPSHDWAAREPLTDFDINARGTLVMLEACRKHCPEAVFIYMSTNKVYGDTPNQLPLVELETRWEVEPDHPYGEQGIDERMPVDQSKHSLFGASKLAADVLVQEYGRYFGLKTACFRGGCLTGPGHSGTRLHGFLSYLVRSVLTDTPYQVFGYKGKQVRDNLHALDLVHMFWHFYKAPRVAEVYNVGGGRQSNCSVREAIELTEKLAGKKLQVSYQPVNRIGDHIWWISDVGKFRAHYPIWTQQYDTKTLIAEIVDGIGNRMQHGREPQ